MNDAATRLRIVTLPWRLALVGYAIVLTVATHWPSLNLGDTGPSDKSIHFQAFALMPFLLWRTRWFSRLGAVFLISLAWCVLDELTQGIEILHRRLTWQDMAANALGVVLVTCWIWALQPVGSTGNRLRLSLHQYVFDDVFSQWRSWFIFGGVFITFALSMVLLWLMLEPIGIEGPLLLSFIFWGLVTGVLWRNIWSTHLRTAIENRACFACGRSCNDLEFDGLGSGQCLACGGSVHVGQWIEAGRPSLKSALRLAAMPALVGVVIFIGGFLAIWLAVFLYDGLIGSRFYSPVIPRLVRVIGTEKALMRFVDFTAVFIVFAITTRLFRWRLAAHYDQPFQCRSCGHDLRGTPTSEGLGRCGECGASFARSPEQASLGFVEQ